MGKTQRTMKVLVGRHTIMGKAHFVESVDEGSLAEEPVRSEHVDVPRNKAGNKTQRGTVLADWHREGSRSTNFSDNQNEDKKKRAGFERCSSNLSAHRYRCMWTDVDPPLTLTLPLSQRHRYGRQ